ncbi:MAG TPA: cell division protein FtsQ/DivIB [Pseudogracilibacillus sp.]|nr:cell division protein FtsQ/DivIB [Pseudogracilibacillus sp.]
MEKKKIVSIEDRIPKLKEARKKKANRRLIIYLFIFFLLIAVIVYLQSPLSHIKTINVNQNDVLSDEEIIKESGLKINTNIWMYKKGKTIKALETHPMIESATIHRSLPSTVEINIKEQKIIGFLKEKSAYHPVLKNGMIIREEDIPYKGEAPILQEFKDDDYLNHMASELDELPNDLFNLISQVSWKPTDKNKYNIELYMNDGFIVHSSMKDFAKKMKSYPSIVSQLDKDDKGIIHMDVGTYFEKIE